MLFGMTRLVTKKNDERKTLMAMKQKFPALKKSRV